MLIRAIRGEEGSRHWRPFGRPAAYFSSGGQSGRRTDIPHERQQRHGTYGGRPREHPHQADTSAGDAASETDRFNHVHGGNSDMDTNMDIPPRPRAPMSQPAVPPPEHLQPSASELRELRLRRFAHPR